MAQVFYLSSHDIGPDSRPRKCEVMREVNGLRANSSYLLVEIDPPLLSRFWDGPLRTFNQIILPITGHKTIRDIGEKPVMVDIVLCPSYSGGVIDERQCSKIGAGTLHSTHAEALKASPMTSSIE